MSSQPIDYAALAEQARQQAAPKVDYAALAQQVRSGSAPASSGPKYSEEDYDDKGVTYFPGEKRNIDPATGRTLRHGMPGSFEGHPENIGEYVPATAGRAIEGATDISRGNVAMGTHKLIQAGTNALAPMAPLMIAGAPITAARVIGGGVVGSKVAGAVANASGATPDQKALSEDIGNLAGGGIAGTGMIRAFLQTPVKAGLGKLASASDGVVSDELLGAISPRALHGLRLLRAANSAVNGAEDSVGLSAIAAKHTEAISALESQLNDALSKANALPPEGPTAKLTDVPDLRVQPSQKPPLNLLEQRKAAFQAAQRGAQGEFQVVPPESAQPQLAKMSDVMGNVQIRPQGPTDAQPGIFRTITPQSQAPGRVTPNMAIYDEPIIEKTAQQIYADKFLKQPTRPPTLLEQFKQWDDIRKIHLQLEDQIGKGQDEIQQWMEEHNQQAPGAKPSAATTAKARFNAVRAAAEGNANAVPLDEPQVPTESTMETLLKKSIQRAQAKKMAAKAGD